MNKEKKTKYNVKVIMFVLLLGSFIALFNETILNVAFPKLMEEMHLSATTVQWLTTGYVLVVGILVPVTAFLIHTFTTKQLYVSAMAIFLVGTICAAASSSFVALLISRIVQALGTGMLIPIMMNSALAVNPPKKHGFVMGICICVISLGPALGPTVSGLLLQYFSWHVLFIILIPVLIICIICGYIFLENTSIITNPKIDYASILLSTIGFAGVIYSISSVGTSSMLSTAIIFIIGLAALILFVKRQLSLKQPILEMRTFKSTVFAIGIILIILIQMLQFSANMIIPMLLQDGLKTSTFVSAITLLPAILLNAVLTPFFGKIYDKVGGEVLIPAGLILICIFTFILSRVTPSVSAGWITLIYCFIMAGIAMALPTIQTVGLSQLSNKNKADGIAIVNTSMQIAGALGSALYVGIMSAYQNSYLKRISNPSNPENQIKAIYNGFGHSLLVGATLIAIGFLVSLLLRRKTKIG